MTDRTASTEPAIPPSGERFVLVLRDAGGSEVQVGRRVAGLLKAALRAWRLKAESVSGTMPAEQVERLTAEVLELRERLARAERKAARRAACPT